MYIDWRWRVSACLGLLLSARFDVPAPARDTTPRPLAERIPELDRAALDARRAIHSCEMEIELHTQHYQNKKPTIRSDLKFYYLISGRKMLHKRYDAQDTPPGWQTWCRNCESDGYVLHHWDLPGEILAAGFKRLEDLPEQNNQRSPQNAIPDPRLLGFNPMQFPGPIDSPIDKFVGAADRSDVSAQEEQIDGLACVRISYRYNGPIPPGARKPVVSYWIAPSQGHGIVRFEWRSDSALATTVIRQKQWSDSGLWFPEHYEWTRSTPKEGLVQRTTATINVKSLNREIPAERFSIPALGLPPGTPVADIPPRRDSKRWTGRELVDLETPEAAAALPQPAGTSRKWFIRGAIALGAISVLFLLEIGRRRFFRSPPHEEAQCAKPSP